MAAIQTYISEENELSSPITIRLASDPEYLSIWQTDENMILVHRNQLDQMIETLQDLRAVMPNPIR